MLRNFKKSIKIYFSIIIIIPIILFSYIWYYDPIQIFHKSFINKDIHLNKEMRQQIAGIINNFEFDSIILGTSMLRNTSGFEASKLLDRNFANLSFASSSFFERNMVISYALKKKNIKTIIFSLDNYYIDLSKTNTSYPIKNYDFLYDDNPLNDFKVYMNDKYIDCIIRFSKESKCIGSINNLDSPINWINSKYYMQMFGGLDNWFKVAKNDYNAMKNTFSRIIENTNKIKNNEKVSLNNINEKIAKSIIYVDEYLLDNVKKYSDTKFIFVFPPYSRINFAIWKQYNLPNYEIHKAIIKYLVEQSSIYKNLEIYGYEDKEFLDNISNYMDLIHYHPKINSMMLQSFKNKTELLTIENVDKYIKIAEDKAQNYNLIEISNKIENFIFNLNK
ncbi:hypothetical protein [Aliarcobacter butzleri]|uniref:hypothetical protein n=1 Tax=Aliarcobacter butzleri TaxID=28197 RepID=UPI0021B547B8|nr:hypothetical protein [Aliarcobacter butzleri]MCT7637853.1 hypothetical protein [Aliarcobacter butzleri]